MGRSGVAEALPWLMVSSISSTAAAAAPGAPGPWPPPPIRPRCSRRRPGPPAAPAAPAEPSVALHGYAVHVHATATSARAPGNRCTVVMSRGMLGR